MLFSFCETQQESSNSDPLDSPDSICIVYGCKCNRKTGMPATCSRHLVLQLRKTWDGNAFVFTKRSRQWIKAIRKHGYGKNWEPTKDNQICGCHFLGGKPGTQETEVNFVPTIFPEKSKSEGYRKTHGSTCVVAGCKHRAGTENCSRHLVLQKKHPKRENLWIQAIRKNREDNDWMPVPKSMICGCHFEGGTPSRATDDLNYVPTIFPVTDKKAKKRPAPDGSYCIVVGCKHKAGRENCSPYLVLQTLEHTRRRSNLWIQAIRKNRQDHNWMPDKGTRICGCHFVGGTPSNTVEDLNYVPTIFPETHKERKKKGTDIRWW